MKTKNFAFIDSQNLHRGVKEQGWKLDYRRFRIWLSGKYHVTRAFMFLGYMPKHQPLYEHLKRCGFELVFKEVDPRSPEPKGNVDVDLTLGAVGEMDAYDNALLITSDGDFGSLVRFLTKRDKFGTVISPSARKCSHLLKKAAAKRITYLSNVRSKVEAKEN